MVMEKSTTEPPAPFSASLYPENKREQVLHSHYFHAVSLNAASMIAAAYIPAEEYEELIEAAISFTDLLIQKVGERI